LASAQKVPGFAVVITDLIFNQKFSPSTRLAASIMLKNFVKSKWDTDQIAESDRQHIKKTALNLMLASPSSIQAQLCEMISLICENDSYPKWMDLLVVSILFISYYSPTKCNFQTRFAYNVE
jgi:exportin-2 (importin alpha re-exporter)